MEQLRYCGVCGGKLEERQVEGQRRLICASCGRISYVNPIPSVVAIIERDGAVLLVKRAVEPGKGYWGLPGGFIETGETVIEAAVREVKEETGLDCRPLDVQGVSSDLGGFYGDILVVCYLAEVIGGELAAGDDAMDLGFFKRDAIPRLAFRCHAGFLQTFWTRNSTVQ